MDETTYIKNRVEEQIEWMGKKSKKNKRNHLISKTIIIILSVLIPFLTGYITDDATGNIVKISVGVSGVIIAALESIQSLLKYQENWVQYRSAIEQLNRENFLFQTKAGLYASSKQPFKDFVAKIESILGDENQLWAEYASSKTDTPSA